MNLDEWKEEVRKAIANGRRKQCWCGTDINPETLNIYDHEDGWVVDGYDEKQWLSVPCPKCNYEWSIWKLGVPRQ